MRVLALTTILASFALIPGCAGHRDASRKETTNMTQAGPRLLRKTAVVNIPAHEAFGAWTTPEGVKSFLGIDARVECRVGGLYEWIFAPEAPVGQQGAEGCRILSFVPNESVSFSWNAPPSIPALRSAEVRTQVCVRFTPLAPDRTRVDLIQSDFGEGEDWDKYYAYFDRAWGNVLKAMETHFNGG